MRTFNDFVGTKELLTESKFKQFLKDHGLMGRWREYKKPKLATYGEPRGWKEDPERPIHELKQVLTKAVDGTRLVGGNGILDINFEVQHKEDVQRGQKITVEMKGTARASNKTQVRRLLEDLMVSSKKALSEQGYHLQVMHNTLHVNENKDEKLDFLVMAVAIYTNK